MTGTKTNAPIIAMKQTKGDNSMTLNYHITDPNTADVLAEQLMKLFAEIAVEKLNAQQEASEAV